MPEGSRTPWMFWFIRLYLKLVVKVFYGSIVVENAYLIPERGIPCIICANHCNSLTDAAVLVDTVPYQRRNYIRFTAKSTLFGQRNVQSRLIEAAGTVPVKRRQDNGGDQDNTGALQKMLEALDVGDAVCLFPEGLSRYHPTTAPLKTGVARIISDSLTRNRDDPDFEVCILPVSVTYMHRQHFRSDVFVRYHAPMRFSPKSHPELLAPADFSGIRAVTSQLQDHITSGLLDSPSWRLVRNAKLAARMYAPLGTQMSLGDHIRVTQTFLDAFKKAESILEISSNGGSAPAEAEIAEAKWIAQCSADLQTHQDRLASLGLKDDRVCRPLPRRAMAVRAVLRLIWSTILISLAFPGLLLWTPAFISATISVNKLKRSGPKWYTYDDIAHHKIMPASLAALGVYVFLVILTFPIAPITLVAVPFSMWMSIRWLEDATAAFRAFVVLVRLIRVGPPELGRLRQTREELYRRVMGLAVDHLGLPEEPEKHFGEGGRKEKGRVRGRWESVVKYFSIRRRRKRDWNESLRLYDKVDFPKEDS